MRGSRASGWGKHSNPQRKTTKNISKMLQLSAGSLAIFALPLATVSANSVTFWTLDNNVRTLYFTPSLGSPVTVSSDANTTVTFPSEYSGNFYAVK